MIVKFLVGCYTSKVVPDGLHLCQFNYLSKSVDLLSSLDIQNASYFCTTEDESIVYTVNESHTSNDSVTAVSLDINKDCLSVLNTVKCGGSDPCYISSSLAQKHVFIANYSDGSLSVANLADTGNFGSELQVIKHEGAVTHMHAAVLSPDQRFLLILNLGLDTLSVYNYDPSQIQPLNIIPEFVFQFPKGTGPRHLVFSASGDFIVVVGELDGTVHVLKWNNSVVEPIQQSKLMPEDFRGINSAADIHFSPNGKFLYVSNRGDANEIIVFSFNATSGYLCRKGNFKTLGVGPRNFAIDPSGKYLFVAHQHSNNIRIFELNEMDGALRDLDFEVPFHQPVCVKFLTK